MRKGKKSACPGLREPADPLGAGRARPVGPPGAGPGLEQEKPWRSLRGRKAAGFTLLEVMIALSILAIVGVAYLRAQGTGLRLVEESGQLTLATLLAREKMAELEGVGFPEVGKTSGPGGSEFPAFHWERRVTATELLSLRKAQVRVLWKDGRQERSLELLAYFARK
ncbi:MAG: prepilin-type N-terminal cleavage/methylation domain-containing protein [Deltaproteobacteria bacterium]|nr:prepilin-type N-terminal cleavage/methylation domain-containing protein [Deltaproteobacteria bacterium]